VADRISLEGPVMSPRSSGRYPQLSGFLLGCGLIGALALATPAAAQSTAVPDAAPTEASTGAGQKTPTGEGAVATATPAASPENASSVPQKKVSGASSGKPAKSASKKSPKAGATPDAKDSGSPFQALSFSSEKGPIEIQSDTLDLDYKGHTVWYRGHVHAKQGTASLNSDTLQVLYGENFKDLKQAIAMGNVRLTQGGRWATSDRADLDQVARTVVMTGNPVIHDGPDQVTGTRILIYLDTQKSVIDKAHAVIFSRSSDTRDDQKPSDHTH